LGILIAMVMYLAISFFAMGAVSREELANSSSPIVDIFAKFVGGNISKVIMVGAVVSILGTTIGWLLSTARVAYAAGQDKMFPQIFGKVHPKYNTPYASLIISSVLVNLLLIFNYSQSKTLLEAFKFIILLATLSFLPVYAFTAASDILLMFKKQTQVTLKNVIKIILLPTLAFIYSIWAVYGAGAEAVMYGFLLMLLGIPFYVYMKIKNNFEEE